METSNEKTELEKILEFSNAELTGNWSKLASLIRIYEERSWSYAKRFAAELLRDKQAIDYIETIRQYPDGKIPVEVKPEKLPEIVPQITRDKKSRSKKNYERLRKVAPDIEQMLLKSDAGDVISGSSKVTGYKDFHVYLFKKDKDGYYLTLAHYHANDEALPDPEMIVYFDIQNMSMKSLSFQNTFSYREVYDDMFDRKLVNISERKAQEIFLGKWLKELKMQGHKIKWKEEYSTGLLPKGIKPEPVQKIEDEPEQEDWEDETQEPESVSSNRKEEFLKLIEALREKREKAKPSLDELLKGNYSLLTEIMPDLVRRLKYRHSKGSLYSSELPEFKIARGRQIDSDILQLIIYESTNSESESQGMILITVNTLKLTAWVSILTNGFNGQEDFLEEQDKTDAKIRYEANSELNQWLESVSYDDYKALWENEPEESEIPDFEPGNVVLTKAHQLEGITQDEIDWINYHRQGMVFVPRRRTERSDLQTLIGIQASRTAFRICMRGKLHYTGRSNRNSGIQ